MKESSLYLQQTLHGYRDGHQLLRSSIRLATLHESQLLLLSDLSGPEYRDNFDGYLTAYPLEGSGYYVLARTWFAHEMPRPGCVWTHSLLIRDDDVPRIPSLDALPFSRPTESGAGFNYEEPAPVIVSDRQPTVSATARLSQIQHSLYSTDATVVVPAASSVEYEHDFFAIFLQQWPRLRRSFRFCSGALLPRDRSFDLVATPHDALLGVERREGFTVPGAIPQSQWTMFASHDIERPNKRYRRFLWSFGPDFSSGRRAFSLLTDAYLAWDGLGSHASPSHLLLDRISSAAPRPEDASRLKMLLFNPQGVLGHTADDDIVVLKQTLVENPTLDAETIAVRRRVRRLDQTAPEALALLFQEASSHPSAGANELVNACLESAETDSLSLERWPESAIVLMVRRDPKLVAKPNVWRGAPERQLALFRRVFDVATDERNRLAALALFFRSGFSELATAASKMWPLQAVRAYVISLASDAPFSVSEYMDALLQAHGDLVAQVTISERLSPLQLCLCAAYLDPLAAEVWSISTDTWLECTGAYALIEPRLRIRASAFCLVMGLRTVSAIGSTLVADTFSSVYAAVARGELSSRLWNAIARECGRSPDEWDRCKVLVSGTVDHFIQRRWSANCFQQTFGHAGETWKRAIRELRQSDQGVTYLDNLREAHRRGTLILSERLSAELHREPRWWQD